MIVYVNGERRQMAEGMTLDRAVLELALPTDMVAAALDGKVVPKGSWASALLAEGSRVEIVTAMAGGEEAADAVTVAGVSFASRLFVGTGKYQGPEAMRDSLRASGTELVTVSVRLLGPDSQQPILPHLEQDRYRLLPNTAGATSAEQAVHISRLGRELLGTNWVKLEVIGDKTTLWPDTADTIEATRTLVSEGFVVLAYTSPDLVAALRLEDAGASAVMPLAAPIGSGQGLQDWASIERIRERVRVPMVVDAGIGVPSDAALAMEMGADAVLVNTAIARAADPVAMARAMRLGVEAGRLAHRAGRIPKLAYAAASSPEKGVPGAAS